MVAIACFGCGDDDDKDDDDDDDDPPADAAPSACAGRSAANDPSLTLPAGFCATIFADQVGRARQLTVTPAGDVLVAIANSRDGLVPGKVLALRDADGDGVAEQQASFGDTGATGIAWREGALFVGQDAQVVRWPLASGALEPTGAAQVVVGALPTSGDHPAKSIQLTATGELLLVVGSETNSCQPQNRTPGTPGLDPCPELATRAALWRFPSLAPGQTLADGTLHTRGVRNATAFAIEPSTGAVITVNNGRDQLHENWPTLFTLADDRVLPAEELAVLAPGGDRGWPYCYHDPRVNQMKLAPEYGGDGVMQGRCAAIAPPMLALPAHWAALGTAFYTGTQFPAAYRGGMFVAFHGSRFDALAEEVPGYSVGFVTFAAGSATGWTQFATGFAGPARPLPDAAAHRPVGVAVGPDGALYVSDDQGGRIWKITYAE